MAEAEISKRTYVVNAIVLMILLGLTIGAAELALGPFSVLVALLIAGTKAVLVALIFMHLTLAQPATRIFAAVGLIWLAILIGLTISDYVTRGWIKLGGSEPTSRLLQQQAPPAPPLVARRNPVASPPRIATWGTTPLAAPETHRLSQGPRGEHSPVRPGPGNRGTPPHRCYIRIHAL